MVVNAICSSSEQINLNDVEVTGMESVISSNTVNLANSVTIPLIIGNKPTSNPISRDFRPQGSLIRAQCASGGFVVFFDDMDVILRLERFQGSDRSGPRENVPFAAWG